jgi:protoheme ferro-lyase
VEARGIAAEHGVTLHRAAAVNAHPEFIAMLADVVNEAQNPTEPAVPRPGHLTEPPRA